jgi:hypothetical protein
MKEHDEVARRVFDKVMDLPFEGMGTLNSEVLHIKGGRFITHDALAGLPSAAVNITVEVVYVIDYSQREDGEKVYPNGRREAL